MEKLEVQIANASEGNLYFESDDDVIEFEEIQDPRALKAAPRISKADGPRKIRRI